MHRINIIIFEDHKISVIIDNKGIIWFNAKQICIINNQRKLYQI